MNSKIAGLIQEGEVINHGERDLIVRGIEWERDKAGIVTHVMLELDPTSGPREKIRFAANEHVSMTMYYNLS